MSAICRGRERRHLDLCDNPCGQVAERQSQRVVGGDLVVPVRADDEDGQASKATTEDTHQIEGRVISPVKVLEDDGRGTVMPAERRQEGFEHAIAVGQAEGSSERAAQRVGDVDERSECPRRRNGVARTPDDPGPCVRFTECLDERRLADARLTGHKGEPAGPAMRIALEASKLFEQLRSLVEGHGTS